MPRRARSSDDFEWLKSKIARLKEFTDKLCEVSDVHYPGHTWSALKLLVLMYWVDVYTKIIGNQPGFRDNFWYIDLLAGPGTTLVQETGDVIVGSPFIAYFFARRQFTRYVFVELNDERVEALARRSRAIGLEGRVAIFHGDCNTIAKYLRLEDAKHYLAFIDCEGFDVDWSTMEYLLQHRGDIILVLQTQVLRRSFGRAKTGRKDAERLTLFMGGESWKKARSFDELFRMYIEKIRRTRRKVIKREPFVDSLRIHGVCGSTRYEFDIILVTKYGPYVESVWENRLKKVLSKFTSKHAEMALKVLKGEVIALDEFSRVTLNHFIPKEQGEYRN